MKRNSLIVLSLTFFVLGFLAMPQPILAVCERLSKGEVDCSAEPLKEEAALLEQLSDQAVEATRAGRYDEALELYRRLEQSSAPSYAWQGISGQVIVNRIAGRGDSARAVTRRIGTEKSELAGLMDIWDGDTAMV